MQARSDERTFAFPSSTYRVQFYGGLTFRSARALVPYLERLGTGAFYSSPFLKARPGSGHGYDVVDHNQLNPELGTAEHFQALMDGLQEAGIGHLVDFVPNHMGVDPASNPYWRDVLENGSCSAHAHYFDIDWDPVKVDLRGKVLLPLLGDQYGRVLERGELRLAYEGGALVLRYWDTELPINPRRAPIVLRHDLDRLTSTLGEDHPHVREFLSILTGLHNLPAYTERDPERIAERRREKEVLRERLQRLTAESSDITDHIERAVVHANGDRSRPESFDLLHELLEVQAYRLAYWRTAAHEVNYRRFFDVNELGGLRVEDAAVFGPTHALLARLIRERVVTGVRIDHADGLYDPTTYFRHLQGLALDSAGAQPAERDGRPLYVVAEKILSDHERLSREWAVHGTTGYTFLNAVNGLFVRRAHARILTRAYVKFTGRAQPFPEVAYHSKRLIMSTSMASELNVLAHELDRMTESNRHSRDFTLNSLRDVLREVVACFPVYRTYVNDAGWTADDAAVVGRALDLARRRNPAMEASIFDFLRAVLLPRLAASPDDTLGDPFATTDEATFERRRAFAMRFQQYTGPVQAKGIEDTAFYRHNVLVSLNEVGGEPDRWGCEVDEFHAQNAARLRDWPFELITTATHDTKLGEDVRARIDVLSELPAEWRKALSTWVRATADCRARVDDEWAPDRNDEYRFFQVLVGCWPPGFTSAAPPPGTFVERIREYMHKAIKEAKLHTSWIRPNQPYDESVSRYVDRVLLGLGRGRFFSSFLPFAQRVAALGMVNSLAQLVLKMASPGVADVYQGNELWDLRLVDPDNRRPVDFAHRQALLDELAPLIDRLVSLQPVADGDTARVAEMAERWEDGRIKLLVTSVGLRLRRADPQLFLLGDYVPLPGDVPLAADVVAVARVSGPRVLIAVVPRFIAALAGAEARWPRGTDWKTSRVLLPDTLPGQEFVNVLTGERLRRTQGRDESWLFVGEALRVAPVALLVAAGGSGPP
jgi:(1->4)-alpha-D-glucan 1-alpha-D-glucosylmutase